MTPTEFQRLLGYYLACLDVEDRRGLRKKLSALHHSLVSPWDEFEPLFHDEAAEIVLDVPLLGDRRVLEKGGAAAGEPERLFYGYPIFVDGEGFLAPLFVCEVAVEKRAATEFALRAANRGELQVNVHLLRAPAEEQRALQEELEGAFGTFANRLRAAFEAIGIEVPEFPRDRLDPYPREGVSGGTWVNRPVLFRSERSVYTSHLRRELEALAKYDNLLRALPETALGTFLGMGRAKGRRSSPMYPDSGTDRARAPMTLVPVVPLNSAQEEAAQGGLHADLSVVTGPPGTGKSQVVVDLLASAALSGQAVLFASKNNKAVDVVRDRMREVLGEPFDFVLRLGSRERAETCHQELRERLGGLGTRPLPPPPDATVRADIEQAIEDVRKGLEAVERARLKVGAKDLIRRTREALVPEEWLVHWDDRGETATESDVDLAALVATLEQLAGRKPVGLWLAIRRLFARKSLFAEVGQKLLEATRSWPEAIRDELAEVIAQHPGDAGRLLEASVMVSAVFSWRAAVARCERAERKLAKLEDAATLATRLDELQRRQSEMAAASFRVGWARRIRRRSGDVGSALSAYFDLSARLLSARSAGFVEILRQCATAVRRLGGDLPVWIVTNLSARRALPLEPCLFDLVVIDEASQCDIPSALPLLFRARRALIIGDPRQLRHICTLSTKEEQELATTHGVDALSVTWSYAQRSLYALAESVLVGGGGSPVFLAEHYRSHHEIIEFSNQTFYGGQLILRTSLGGLSQRVHGEPLGVFWHDVPGSVRATARSAQNDIEVDAAIKLLDQWASGPLSHDGVTAGVVTPFRFQMEALELAVRARPWFERLKGRVTVGTAHRFQGDECDLMIFSPVVAPGLSARRARWVAETDQLLNVAITRARSALHVVGDRTACLAAGGSLAEFVVAVGQLGGAAHSGVFESPAEERMAELLAEAGLWFAPQHVLGPHRLDFLVVSPMGNRYDVEVDGRGHYTDDAVRADAIRDADATARGLRVVRVEARAVLQKPKCVVTLLRGLV